MTASVPTTPPSPSSPGASGVTGSGSGRVESVGTAGWRVHWFDEIGSTNTWLAEGARAGTLVPGDVAVARYQSAGRGRLDRRWEAPIDSALMMSVLVRPAGALEHLSKWHRLGLVVGVTLVEVCGALGAPLWSARSGALTPTPAGDDALGLGGGPGSVGVALKWPNDLMVIGYPSTAVPEGTKATARKLAGILLEAVPPIGVVCGMGLNRTKPKHGGAPTGVWLSELCDPPSTQAMAALVLDTLSRRLHQAATDWTGLHAAYLAACSTVGQEVRVELPGGVTIEGVAVGVDADGHLQVADRLGGGHDLAVGDVVHVRGI